MYNSTKRHKRQLKVEGTNCWLGTHLAALRHIVFVRRFHGLLASDRSNGSGYVDPLQLYGGSGEVEGPPRARGHAGPVGDV